VGKDGIRTKVNFMRAAAAVACVVSDSILPPHTFIWFSHDESIIIQLVYKTDKTFPLFIGNIVALSICF
jgi:hypothetical protein